MTVHEACCPRCVTTIVSVEHVKGNLKGECTNLLIMNHQHQFSLIGSLSFSDVVVTRKAELGGNFLVVDVGCCIIEKCVGCALRRIRAFPTQSGSDIIIPIGSISQVHSKKIRSERGNHQKGKTMIWYTTPTEEGSRHPVSGIQDGPRRPCHLS